MPRSFEHIAAKGERFGKWLVLEDAKASWLVRCECGKEKEIPRHFLIRGLSTQCASCAQRKHGMEGSAIYNVWAGMKQRCQNPKYHGYARYGGRGIFVCERWQEFDAFYADMGDAPQGMSLGRINNDGPYSPENCRWETPTQQVRNRSVTAKISDVPIAELAEKYGIPAKRLRERLKSGWPLDKALSLPPNKHNRV